MGRGKLKFSVLAVGSILILFSAVFFQNCSEYRLSKEESAVLEAVQCEDTSSQIPSRISVLSPGTGGDNVKAAVDDQNRLMILNRQFQWYFVAGPGVARDFVVAAPTVTLDRSAIDQPCSKVFAEWTDSCEKLHQLEFEFHPSSACVTMPTPTPPPPTPPPTPPPAPTPSPPVGGACVPAPAGRSGDLVWDISHMPTSIAYPNNQESITASGDLGTAIRFRAPTGTSSCNGIGSMGIELYPSVVMGTAEIVISRNPHDFSSPVVGNAMSGQPCFAVHGSNSGLVMYLRFDGNRTKPYVCALVGGEEYYLNFRPHSPEGQPRGSVNMRWFVQPNLQ